MEERTLARRTIVCEVVSPGDKSSVAVKQITRLLEPFFQHVFYYQASTVQRRKYEAAGISPSNLDQFVEKFRIEHLDHEYI